MAKELTPLPDDADIRRLPPGVRHLARWVKLCQVQGTRLVDEIAAWRLEASRANDIAERHAAALERVADALGGTEEETDEQQD